MNESVITMITFFALPKSFKDHISVIQSNALQSWKHSCPDCEIILFGDDEGVAQKSLEYDCIHIPDVKKNEYGTPLLNDIFQKAEQIAKNDIICYINADIIITHEFRSAITNVSKKFKSFLVSGRRWNLDFKENLNFKENWETLIIEKAKNEGVFFESGAIDYFAFSKKFYGKIPPFAIGRTAWDNWLIYEAVINRKGKAIDASQVIWAIHQNHDYNHLAGGHDEAFKGKEAEINKKLAEGHFYSLDFINWIYDERGIHFSFQRFFSPKRQKFKQSVIHLALQIKIFLFAKHIISPKVYDFFFNRSN